MAGRTIPVQLGDVELLIETTTVPGSEPMARGIDVAQRAADALDRAHEAIVQMASSTAKVIDQVAARAARPDELEIEFGLKISAEGNVIVAGASAEATLVVKLIYKPRGGA
jgi:hypothetical protein